MHVLLSEFIPNMAALAKYYHNTQIQHNTLSASTDIYHK